MENGLSEQFNFIGVGITIIVIFLLSFLIDIESLKMWVMGVGIWAPLAFIFLKILTLVVAPLSGSPLYPLVGLLFGFWPGLLYVALGDFLGFTICFGISRIFGKKIAEKIIGDKDKNLLSKIINHVGTPKGFFHASLALFVSTEILSYGAGLSKLPYLKFILILWPISLIVSIILVLLGSNLIPSNSSLVISAGVPMLGALCIAIGGSLFVRAVKAKI
ncbi:MAG: VTT domain-containing protein [Candidatus Paceibacterota bacterium]|jgi:uncharacterized membrane protein YdjX (TVP38/TMEM64 family)